MANGQTVKGKISRIETVTMQGDEEMYERIYIDSADNTRVVFVAKIITIAQSLSLHDEIEVTFKKTNNED